MKSSKLSGIIVWSLISAAFIGPGTVTTALKAGSSHGIQLLWTIAFATLACFLVQEIAARITLSSSMTLGQAMIHSFGKKWGQVVRISAGLVVIAGCIAYEAGNILGAVSGIGLIVDVDPKILTIVLVAFGMFILWLGQPQWISGVMMLLVGFMAIGFVYLALARHYSTAEVINAFRPTVPVGSEFIIVALIGTTIVPYNVFLGSRLGQGQTVGLMRTGLSISVAAGGAITAMILIAGTWVEQFTTFKDLTESFHHHTGFLGTVALASGLFAAGFSSSVTAPYAASIIGSSVMGLSEKRSQLIWFFVLLVGLGIGVSDIQPIPVILVVQALNGLVLPLVVLLLIVMANNKTLLPEKRRPGVLYNVLLILVWLVVTVISGYNVYRAWINF